MAAADYYTASAIPSMQQNSSPYLAPPPQPQRTYSGPPHPNPSQQQAPPPPPYQPFQEEPKPNVHFAPPPAELQQRHSFSGQQRPSFSNNPPHRSSLSNENAPPHRSSLSHETPPPHRSSLSHENAPPHRSSLSKGSPRSSPRESFANTPQRGSFSSPQRPSPPQTWYPNGPTQYPPPPNQFSMTERPQMAYGTPPQQNGFLAPPPAAPHMHPYMENRNASQYSLESGYSSDPESRRRHHKHRSRRDSHDSKAVRDIKGRSRSTNTDAFVGAAGGGLIGDLIFPGLGTLGGAALGWLGGKDYGNHRKWREDKRERDQKQWEDKHRSSRSRGDSPERYDDRGRKHSHERRHSHY